MDYIYTINEKPEIGVPVIVYRPQTLYQMCYERPLDIAVFDGKNFSCHHQPKQWAGFKLPSDWTDEHTKYQGFK